MNAAPLGPPPDVDKALLVRQALDMDWPPGPAVDVFLERAIERLIGEPMPDDVLPARPAPVVFVPEPDRRTRCAACGQMVARLAPYEPRPGSVTAKALAALREAGRPMHGQELSRVIGHDRKAGGIAPYMVALVQHGMVRRLLADGKNPRYEAVA